MDKEKAPIREHRVISDDTVNLKPCQMEFLRNRSFHELDEYNDTIYYCCSHKNVGFCIENGGKLTDEHIKNFKKAIANYCERYHCQNLKIYHNEDSGN